MALNSDNAVVPAGAGAARREGYARQQQRGRGFGSRCRSSSCRERNSVPLPKTPVLEP